MLLCSSGWSNFKLVKPIGVVIRSFSVTGTAGQGDLNKDAELVRWSQNTPQVPYNKHLMISQFKHLWHQDVILWIDLYKITDVSRNTKGGSITLPLTSCLIGLDLSVLQIKTKIVSSHTADPKPVQLEVNSTVILPHLVFRECMYNNP